MTKLLAMKQGTDSHTVRPGSLEWCWPFLTCIKNQQVRTVTVLQQQLHSFFTTMPCIIPKTTALSRMQLQGKAPTALVRQHTFINPRSHPKDHARTCWTNYSYTPQIGYTCHMHVHLSFSNGKLGTWTKLLEKGSPSVPILYKHTLDS